jgi:hypothetical protein
MNKYLVLQGDIVQGPFGFDELKYGKISNLLDASTLVKKEGDTNWLPILEHSELAELVPNKKSSESGYLLDNSWGDPLDDGISLGKVKAPSATRYISAWLIGGLVFWLLDLFLYGRLIVNTVAIGFPDKILILGWLGPIISALISMMVFITVYRVIFKELNAKKVLPYHLFLGLPLFIIITGSQLVQFEFDFMKDPTFLFMCPIAFIATNILPFWLPSSSYQKKNETTVPPKSKRSKPFIRSLLWILFFSVIAIFAEDLFKFISSDTKATTSISDVLVELRKKPKVIDTKMQTFESYVVPNSILELEQKARAVNADDWSGNQEAYTEALVALRHHMASQTSSFSGESLSSPEARNYADLLQSKLQLYGSKIEYYKGLSKNSELKQKYPVITEIMPLVGGFWGYEAGLDVVRSQCANHGVDIAKYLAALERENEPVAKKIKEIDQNFDGLDIARLEIPSKAITKKQLLERDIDYVVNLANVYNTSSEKICSSLVTNRAIFVKGESFKVKFATVYDELMAM